jgi:hypothetical protein
MVVIRYADDTVLGFQHLWEAKAFRQALEERLKRFGLELHPEKTRTLQFGRYAVEARERDGKSKPETFDFLGFTHYCTRARSNGGFVVGRKTIAKRLRAQLAELKAQLRRRLHRPIHETGQWLNRVLRGHLAYYAVPGNGRSISSFVYRAGWLWCRMLRDGASAVGCLGSVLNGSVHVTFRQCGSSILNLCIVLTPIPKGGAQCVSSARWDLCGGRRVTSVPTATVLGVGIVVGATLQDAGWIWKISGNWAFTEEVVNWERVQEIAKES